MNTFTAAVKRFTSMVFRRSSYRAFTLLGTRVDYSGEVGDGTKSSTVAAVLNWVARTFPEAPPMLWRELADGQEEQVRGHDMLRLLRKPNDYYTGVLLWMATVIDWMVDGNAYWLKVRDQTDQVIQLWWVPHWMIEPKGSDTEFISYYEYRPENEPLRVDPEDIVHFRFGLDPDDPKLGMSQLKSLLREVYTDDEAANFTASLLRNMGVPGLVISPEKSTTLNEGDALAMKQYVNERFGGDKRGEAMVMTGATQIAQFGFSPEQLLLRELRRIPEERVSAVTGIPAIVVGFGAGLERSTFTNMGEAREAAYEAGLIPMQRIMAEEVLFQLLSDFEPDVYEFRFGFDLSEVRVFKADQNEVAKRHNMAVLGGWEKVGEARRAMNLPIGPDDDMYLRPANYTEVPVDGPLRPLAPTTPPAAMTADLAAQLDARDGFFSTQIEDLKAIAREHQQPVALPDVKVEFHEGAFQAPPAPHVDFHVEPPPPAVVNVNPEIRATLDVPKRTLVMRRDNGDQTTYEETDQED